MTKSRKNRLKSRTRGWSKAQPNSIQRTMMIQKCGKKCFLGPNKSFPICSKNTCRINKKGVLSAYMRAKEYVSIKGTQKYRKIAKKALKLLQQ